MTKTISPTAKIRKLERELAECRAAAPPIYLACRGLVLDRLARVVTYKSNPVALSPTEFAMLEILLLHPGETLTREFLIAKVWAGRTVSDNMADAMVFRLREKLGAEAAELIVNVRGEGYTIDSEEETAA